MAERAARRLGSAAALIAIATALGGSCAGSDSEEFAFGGAMLQTLCESPGACQTEGDAERTTGLTSDTVGFQLRGGSVIFSVDAIEQASGSDLAFAAIQVLVARAPGQASTTLTATLEPSCEGCAAPAPLVAPVSEEYAWVTIAGARGFDDGAGGSSDLSGGTLELRGSGIDVAELRVGDFFGGGCSVAPARAGRR